MKKLSELGPVINVSRKTKFSQAIICGKNISNVCKKTSTPMLTKITHRAVGVGKK